MRRRSFHGKRPVRCGAPRAVWSHHLPLHSVRREAQVRICATSHEGATVTPMSLHPIARRPRVQDARRHAGCDLYGDGPFFHNSSITPRVPGDPNTSHQVQSGTTHGRLFLPATAFTPTRRDPLHASNYLIIGSDMALPPTPITRPTDHRLTSTHQHFQGGGTGSNPVGGAQWAEPRLGVQVTRHQQKFAF